MKITIYASTLMCSLCFSLTAFAQTTQNVPVTAAPHALNLDAEGIAKKLVKEEPLGQPKPDAVSAEPNKVDELFKQAEKHDMIPSTVEIGPAGTPQRITKVTGADGSYCVYSPSVARTDGIDEIQNGAQTQVRTCPK